MIGYSGGAIATEWAAELAPGYAPDVDRRLVGAALGGVLVHPAHNLHYVDGSAFWAGVDADGGHRGVPRLRRRPHAVPERAGLSIYNKLQHASITDVLGSYPGLTWAQLAQPQYATPESVRVFVHLANQLIMGTGGTPTIPLFIGQGANGALEGTPGDKPGIGPGDGVMIAGDVRSLARHHCDQGVAVEYRQYDDLSHITTALSWLPAAGTWLSDRFSARPAPSSCATIAPGNPLTPLPE